MNGPKRKHPRLVDRDYEILDHITRYRLSTREVLHALFFDDSEINAVTKVTSRLREYGVLQSFTLFGDRKYFTLGPVGKKVLGLGGKKDRKFGPQALAEHFAMLQFCCMGKHPRERLLVREVAQLLGQTKGKHLRLGSFYVDHQSENSKLSSIRVDHGSDPGHILRTCKSILENQLGHPKIAELVKEQRYMMAIVTTEDTKVLAIQDAILKQPWPITFRVEAVPDLTSVILANQPTRRGSSPPSEA